MEQSNAANSKSETTIILDNSDHAKHFNTAELIHKSEFYTTLGFIQKALQLAKKQPEREHLHNTITLSGSRGSGKTSFLLSVVNWIQEPKEEIKGIDLSSLQVLGIIDPTLIEEKGHVFLNVISLITDLVEKKLDKSECEPSGGGSSMMSRKEWRSSLNKLAAGLPSIDGIGPSQSDHWQDPEFVMDNGLKAVAAAQKLAIHFNAFLEKSLSILQKSAFLLIFDDIDVDASKGWAVLETIRKYFTGSTLITIISGDLELYATVVRQKKWENFGKDILKYEGKELSRLPEFNQIITKLESQYLQKILQPQYRIHLLTIGECKLYNQDKLIYIYSTRRIESEQQDTRNEVKNLYVQILKFFGIVNKYQAEAYYTYLLGLPLRTQIQFLALFKLPDGAFPDENTANPAALTDVFLSDLNANAINVSVAVNNPKSLNRIILKFLLKEKKLEELYQLQPITTNSSLNATLLSLNFLLAVNIKNDPYLIFDYFIKIGYIRNLVPLIPYRTSNESVLTSSIEELCDNSIAINDNILKDITGRIIAYLRGRINSDRVSKAGTIPLYGEAGTSKGDKASMSYRIDQVLKGKASFVEHMLVYMPLSSNQYVNKQSSLLTYSIYLLFGAIGELIRKAPLNDVNNGFSELSQLRSYMMPDFRSGSTDTGEEDNPEPQYATGRMKQDVPIEDLFTRWVKGYNGHNISPHLLGKISTRFFFAVTAIENSSRGKKLGEVFDAHIVAFMHAVLIEDCRENSDFATELTLSNTNFSDDNFIKNLEKVLARKKEISEAKTEDSDALLKVFEEKIGFSKWLISCPLILAYLRPDHTELRKLIISYCGLDKGDKIFTLKISGYLDEIFVKNSFKFSMGSIRNYPQIYDLLVKQNINQSDFHSRKLNDVKTELNELEIGSVTANNLKKYNEWRKKNKKA